MDVYLNGRMVPADQATIHYSDAGFQHAVGLFETMAAFGGRIFRLQPHLERLALSAKTLGLTPILETGPLAGAVNKTLKHNGLQEARVRLTITAASQSLRGPTPGQLPQPTLVIEPTPPTRYDPVYFERGITVLIAPPLANPFDPLAGHKTLSYWSRLRALRQAASVHAGEAIILNVTNHLAGGAVSNIFLVKDGRLLTPFARGEEAEGALPAPVLPGITRAAVIELAQRRSIDVERRMLSIHDLLDADEIFLTNSSWQVLPVSAVEKKSIGEGAAGEMTRDLRQALLEMIQDETTRDDTDGCS